MSDRSTISGVEHAAVRGGRPGWAQPAALVAALLLGSVLAFSAITKMISPKAFVASVEAYGVLPPSTVLAAATGLVGLEFALGLMLVIGIFRRSAAWITLPLVLLFIGMILHAMRVGISQCGCFGEVIKLSPGQELIVDVVLLVLTALVLWRGEDVRLGSLGLRHGFAWGGLCLGAVLFLLGGPAPTTQAAGSIEGSKLTVLSTAEPPVPNDKDALYFFFSADCDHCWSFAPAVELSARRLEGVEVRGITFSDPFALEEFRRAFNPSYPLHVLSEPAFNSITREYPAAVWIQDGNVVQSWAGFVPSHRALAEIGGYTVRGTGDGAAAEAGSDRQRSGAGATSTEIFGGPVRGRH